MQSHTTTLLIKECYHYVYHRISVARIQAIPNSRFHLNAVKQLHGAAYGMITETVTAETVAVETVAAETVAAETVAARLR